MVARLGAVAAIAVGALGVALKVAQDPEAAKYADMVWPPTAKSAPFLSALSVVLAVLVYWTFFAAYGQTAESKRVRAVKRRLMLAQMNSATKWAQDDDEVQEKHDEAENKDDDAKKAADEEAKKKEAEKEAQAPKKPPTANDLFNMVFDDVEERHATDYDIKENEEPYVSVRRLFEQRISADLQDALKFTSMARKFESAGMSAEAGFDVEKTTGKYEAYYLPPGCQGCCWCGLPVKGNGSCPSCAKEKDALDMSVTEKEAKLQEIQQLTAGTRVVELVAVLERLMPIEEKQKKMIKTYAMIIDFVHLAATKKKKIDELDELTELVESRHANISDLQTKAIKDKKVTKLEELVAIMIDEAKNKKIPEIEKKVTEFKDGTKLADLVELVQKKVLKQFGKTVLSDALIKDAKECVSATRREQRKGVALLIPIVAPLLPLYAVSVAMMSFDAVLFTTVWSGMGTHLDKIADGNMTLDELFWACVKCLMICCFCKFGNPGAHAVKSKVTGTFRLKIRAHLMRCMVRQDTAYFDIMPASILQDRLNTDADLLSSKLFNLPMHLIEQILILAAGIYTTYSLQPELAKLVIFPLPFLALIQYYMCNFMDKLGHRQRKIAEASAAGTMEVLKEIRTVREFAMEEEEADKFGANNAYRAQIEEYGSAIFHILFISPLICTMVAVKNYATFLAGKDVQTHHLTVGQAIQIISIADRLQHCFRDIMFLAQDIPNILSPLERICDMLTSKPKIEPKPGDAPGEQPERFKGHIKFEDVEFTFPSEPHKQILYGVSWEVKPGEKVAFVGATGCGKSTSIKLIERFYQPNAGRILLDGKPIGVYDIHHLRRCMSVVAQENVLFSTTIRENIIYGLPREKRESISEEEIIEVCKKANAWKFIQDFPRGLETYCGEKGVKMSGGQKQRLAIARAIIRNPTIVLLDEATSALDSKSELVVQTALDQMMSGSNVGCTLVIAHRLSTVKNCDRTIVMDKGCVMENDSHESLLKIPIKKEGDRTITGWYRDLWETQMGKGDSDKIKDSAAKITELERTLMKEEAENVRLCLQTSMDKHRHLAGFLQAPEHTRIKCASSRASALRRIQSTRVETKQEDASGPGTGGRSALQRGTTSIF